MVADLPAQFVLEGSRKFSLRYVDFTDIWTPSVSNLPLQIIKIDYFTSYSHGVLLIEIIKVKKWEWLKLYMVKCVTDEKMGKVGKCKNQLEK